MTQTPKVDSHVICLAQTLVKLAVKDYDDGGYQFVGLNEILSNRIAVALSSYGDTRALEATEKAAKECDDRAAMPDSVCNAAYRQGASDCAVFIRGSVTRTYATVYDDFRSANVKDRE